MVPEIKDTMLEMSNVTFPKFSFEKKEVAGEVNLTINYKVNYRLTPDNKKVGIMIEVAASDKEKSALSLSLEAIAYFSVQGYETIEPENKDIIFKVVRHGIILMAPFITGQVSLITTQPNMPPLILPISDFRNLAEEKTTKESSVDDKP